MRLNVPPAVAKHLALVAERKGVSTNTLVEAWLIERLEREPPVEPERDAKCLASSCPRKDYIRGLCARHYQRFRFLVSQGCMTEGWLVHRGKILPARGRTIQDYQDDGMTSTPPGRDAVTLWFFGVTS